MWPFRRLKQETGYVPDPEQEKDPRNLEYEKLVIFGADVIPAAGDIEKKTSKTFNQGGTSSCTCQATCGVIYQWGNDLQSPRHSFWKIKTDSAYKSSGLPWGAYMTDPFRMQIKEGICDYDLAPNENIYYDADYLDFKTTAKINKSANDNMGGSYMQVARAGSPKDRFDSIVRYLAQEKRPLAVGVRWYREYNKYKRTGIIPPTEMTGPSAGHAMMAVAWKTIDGHEYLGFRNSWGEKWGDKGRVWIPKDNIILFSAIGFMPPRRAEEIRIEKVPEKAKKDIRRNLHRERANAWDLRRWIEEVYFKDDGETAERTMNAVARGIAGREWLVLVWAVSYLGWTHKDVINYLQARSRGLEKEKAYNLDFTQIKD